MDSNHAMNRVLAAERAIRNVRDHADGRPVAAIELAQAAIRAIDAADADDRRKHLVDQDIEVSAEVEVLDYDPVRGTDIIVSGAVLVDRSVAAVRALRHNMAGEGRDPSDTEIAVEVIRAIAWLDGIDGDDTDG